jgi:uncharacterized protein (DUF2336 family)
MPHNTAPNPLDRENAVRDIAGVPAATPESLIEELENAIAQTDLRRRASVLRRVTDLFIMNGTGFSEQHIAMFDEVMSRLINAIDTAARAEFGELIAKHPNSPVKTSRILALDNEIEVAGPILAHSEKLDEATLLESAKTKSQDHLYAISLRDSIGEAVTDVLVERGDRKVVISTAANPGAQFSEFGCSTLASRSRDDNDLPLRVWQRSDIPRQHLLRIFAAASEEVRTQLETADRQKAQLYRYMVAQAKNQIQGKMRDSSPDYTSARQVVESLHAKGDLSGERLLTFAQNGKFDEVTIALSLMSELPIGHIERAILHDQTDHLLVLAKASGLSWETAKAVLQMRLGGKKMSSAELDAHCRNFKRLQYKTAISAMQFYRLRVRAEAQLEAN